jgi:hypothetical protein
MFRQLGGHLQSSELHKITLHNYNVRSQLQVLAIVILILYNLTA